MTPNEEGRRPESDELLARNDRLLRALDDHVDALDAAITHLLDVVAEQDAQQRKRQQ